MSWGGIELALGAFPTNAINPLGYAWRRPSWCNYIRFSLSFKDTVFVPVPPSNINQTNASLIVSRSFTNLTAGTPFPVQIQTAPPAFALGVPVSLVAITGQNGAAWSDPLCVAGVPYVWFAPSVFPITVTGELVIGLEAYELHPMMLAARLAARADAADRSGCAS
jgi:hypothetical protein